MKITEQKNNIEVYQIHFINLTKTMLILAEMPVWCFFVSWQNLRFGVEWSLNWVGKQLNLCGVGSVTRDKFQPMACQCCFFPAGTLMPPWHQIQKFPPSFLRGVVEKPLQSWHWAMVQGWHLFVGFTPKISRDLGPTSAPWWHPFRDSLETKKQSENKAFPLNRR